MDYDCILKVIGRKNIFFVLSLTLLSFISYITSIQMHILSVSLFRPAYQCQLSNSILSKRDINNISAYISIDECLFKQTVTENFKQCSDYKFDKSQMKETLITEYNLICHRKYIITIMYYLQLLNIPLVLLFGYLADYIGRKGCLILLLSLHMIGQLGIALIDQLGVIVTIIAFNKLTIFSDFLGMIWMLELSDVNKSEIAICVYVIPGIISSLAISIMSYLTRRWRLTYLISALPTVLWFLIMFIPESPRWLLVRNRHKLFVKSVKSIAKWNKVHVSNDFLDDFIEETEWIGPSRMSMGEFCKFPTLRHRLAMLSILGLSISVFPTQFTVNIGILQPNDISIAYGYISCINSIFLLPLICNLCIRRVGKLIKLTFTIVLIMYVISLFLNKANRVEFICGYVLAILSRNLTSSCRIMLIALACFLMPTTHRCFAAACIISCFIFGGIISSVFKDVRSMYHYNTNFNIFVLVSSILGGLLLIGFHYLVPRLTTASYPPTPYDADKIEIGNESQIHRDDSEKQSNFTKKHNLSP